MGTERRREAVCFMLGSALSPQPVGRRAEAAEGSAWPQPRYPSLGSRPHVTEAHLARLQQERMNTVTPLLHPLIFLPVLGAKGPGPRP